jgi:hypothetical protein
MRPDQPAVVSSDWRAMKPWVAWAAVLGSLLVPGCSNEECGDPCTGAICAQMGLCGRIEDCECAMDGDLFSKDSMCRCSVGYGSAGCCIATSNGDCLNSTRCAESAYCSLSGTQCVIGSDADCRSSEQCRKDGDCFLGDEQCVARSDADCRASGICRDYGNCTLQWSGCAPGTEQDCQSSNWCLEHGSGCTLCTDSSCEDDCARQVAPCCR